MSDPTFSKMNLGFAVFAIAVFVWASIDYNRFIKFWMLRPAPYSQRVRSIFRVFFFACVVGGVSQLVKTMPAGKPASLYLGSLLVAAVWFVVFFVMLRLVEWMNQKRRMKQSQVLQS
jgi:undecaprenyl pyrophosphate phosphatase UppP